MSKRTALPLAQQMLAWSLQAMGLLDDESAGSADSEQQAKSRVSRSTAKNALKGAPIPRTWDRLIDHVFHALGLVATQGQREAVTEALHELDRKVSMLDRRGLSLEDQLPPVVRLLAPHIGVRFGALAALADLLLVPDSSTGRPPPPIGEALCDPLSPRFFGAVVDFLLWHHRPEWQKRHEQVYELEKRGVAAKSTLENWHSGQIFVPNIVNLVALARSLGTADDQRRALGVLRFARLLVVARQDLGRWGGEALAEETEKVVAAWARTTRATLVRNEAPAELAELVAEILECDSGEVALGGLRSRYPFLGLDGALPLDVAKRLRERAAEVREGNDAAPLRWLILDQILAPVPLIMPFVGQHLTGGRYLLTMAADPFDTLQGAWTQAAMLNRVVSGGELQLPMPGVAEPLLIKPDESLKRMANELLAGLRRVGHGKEEKPQTEVQFLQFLVALLCRTGVRWDPRTLTDAWNDAKRLFYAPPGMEPFMEGDEVEAAPHLATVRAKRLASEGETLEALDWLRWWDRQPRPTSWEERMAAAETMARIAHSSLDQTSDIREFVRAVGQEATDELLEELAIDLGVLPQELVVLLEKTREACEGLLDRASALSVAPPDARAAIGRISMLLPLHVRVAHIMRELVGEDGGHLQRAEALALDLSTGLEALPTHGEAWATLAAWQELQGLDSLAPKRAKHFGTESLLIAIREQFARDGLFDQK